MTTTVIFTTQTDSWEIVTEIDLYDTVTYPSGKQDDDGEITAHITIHTTTPGVETAPNVTIYPVGDTDPDTVTIGKRTPPSNRTAVAKYEVTTTTPATKTPVNVSISTGSESSTIISIPRIPFLKSLKEIREFDSKTPEEIRSIITTNYPQNNPRTAANKFDRSCISVTPPDEHLPITNAVLKEFPRLINYRDQAEEYVAKHAFELGDISYTHTNTDIETVGELVQLYNDQDKLPNVTGESAVRRALYNALEKDSLHELNHVKTQLIGDTWSDALTDYNRWFLTVLLVGNGYEDAARQINTQHDVHIPGGEYETRKQEIQQYPDVKQTSAWGELLPTAVMSYPEDFNFVVSNLAYWLAGDLNSQHKEVERSSYIYGIAETQLSEYGSDHFAAVARLRERYTAGLHHRQYHRRDAAREEFRTVARNWDCSPKAFSDTYSVFGSIEQLITLTLLDWAENDEITVEDVISELEEVKSMMPPERVVPSRTNTRYDDTQVFLQAALAEFTGRKLNAASVSEEVPVEKQIQKQFETAIEGYGDTDNPRHANRVKDALHNLSVVSKPTA